MNRRLRTLLMAILASLSCSAVAAPACVDQGGIGGTGRAPKDGGIGGTGAPTHGIGGTGAPASGTGGTGAPVASGIGGTGAPASGIGGTGAQASGVGGTGMPANGGIGGTGIVGTITGFASVCINGVEVHFEAETPVDMNAQPATIANLAVGQVVAIHAGHSARGLEARSISIVNAYEGPVTDIARDGTLRVMGQPVRVVQGQVPAGLRVGDKVRVGGLRAPGGELLATYLVDAPDLSDASVAGVVADRRRVGGVTVTRPLGKLAAALVRGRWIRDALQAREILPDPAVASLRGVDRAIIEGIVQDRAGESVRLGAIDVRIPAEIMAAGDAPVALRTGTRVRITANRDAASMLRAETVQLLPDSPEPVEPIERQRSADDGSSASGDQERSGSNDDAVESDDRDRSGSDDGKAEPRTDSVHDDDGSELRPESDGEADDERSGISGKRVHDDAGSAAELEVESDDGNSGRSAERFERDERRDDDDRSESRERTRAESGDVRSEQRSRGERFDESERRIERRDRDDERAIERQSRRGREEADVRNRERFDRIERTERFDGTERVERVERFEEPEKIERVERIEEPEKVERVERIEEPEKVERVERIEEPEKVERVERIEEPEKVERVERIEEPEKVERVERIEEPEKIERIESVEEPERVERIERIEEPDEVERVERVERIDDDHDDFERIDKSGPGS